MKISVSVSVVFALWLSMSMVNASPLSHKKNEVSLSQEKLQAIAQSCGWSDAIQCGSVAASCGATCYNSGITSSTCISCLGSSYSTCKDCISSLYEEKKLAAIENQVDKSSQVLSQEFVEAIAQSCGWTAGIQCASSVASCGTTCYNSGITSSACTSCFGSSYSTCKDCISSLYEERKQAAIENQVEKSSQVLSQEYVRAIAQSCGWSAGIQCASSVASCGTTCYNSGITSSACTSCFGSSYGTCKDCISSLYEERKQAAIENQVDKSSQVLSQEFVEAIAQSCGWTAGIQCASSVASCGTTCYNSGIASSACTSCFGSSYSTCKDCIASLYEEKKQAAIESQVKKSIQVLSQEYVQAIAQSCGWSAVIQCGSVVASCTTTCSNSGITSSTCISCLGSSYSTCKDCIQSVTSLYEEKK